MDPSQPECNKCGLYLHTQRNPIPPGGELGWSLYRRLTSPAVERFGFQAEIMESIGLRLTHRRTLEVVESLDEIMVGIDEAKRELAPAPTKK